MREYTTQDGNRIRKNGRAKKIYFNIDGSSYFLWNGRRQRLDDIPRLTYPVFFENEDGKTDFCSGYICLCNWGGVLVQIDDSGEAVQLYDEIQN